MTPQVSNNDYFLLKKGYIHPTRETRIPIVVRLNPEDPLYTEKLNAMMNQFNQRSFFVSDNLNDPEFMNLIFFVRYYMLSGTKENII